MKTIPLTRGKFAIVDDEDYVFLSGLNWNLAVNKFGEFRTDGLSGAYPELYDKDDS